TATPEVAETNQNPPPNTEQNQTANAATPGPAVASNTQSVFVAHQQAGPTAPALGPSEPPSPSPASGENSDQSSTASADESNPHEKSKATESTSNRRSSTSRTVRRSRDSYIDQFQERPVSSRQHRAQVVGHTRDGRLIVRLSSGRVIVLPRVNEEVYPSYPR